jgi:hypothetical protein
VKIALRIIIIIGIFFITLEVSTYFYRSIYSKSIASGMIQKLCRDQGYDLTKLSGPVDGSVGGCPASYSWTYQDSTHHLELLVSFDYSYDPKIAIWDFNRKD